MPAASVAEWLTAGAVGVAAFTPGALLILSLDHPRPSLAPAREAVGQAVLWLVVLIHLIPTGGRR